MLLHKGNDEVIRVIKLGSVALKDFDVRHQSAMIRAEVAIKFHRMLHNLEIFARGDDELDLFGL